MAYESFPVFKGPQCLIESSKDGKLKVVDDVLTQISHIQEKLNIVAITGIYKTGKSYLLNRLAQANKASTNNAVTMELTTDSKSIARPSVASTSETSTTLVPTTTTSIETSSSPTGTSTHYTETSTSTTVTVSCTFIDVVTTLAPSTASEVPTSTLASTSETSTTSVASASSAVIYTRQTTSSSASTGTPQTAITSAMSTTSCSISIPSQTSTSSSSTRTSTTGFPLGSTIESKTKGIWAWCLPHLNRKDEVLLLLDTEGLGDIKKGDGNHDNWIFTLATLLADTLVYNVKGAFDQDALEKLRFITEMSKHVTTSANKKEDDNLDLYFPRFILTLRDFTLDLEKDGKEMTSDEYLKYCLSLRDGANEFNIKYNAPRMCIRKYFKKRKCFTFEIPGGKGVLRELETSRDEKLAEGFVADSNKFTTYVLDKCHSKCLVNGQPVNGGMFATLTQTYVTAILDGKIPCIESSLELMAQCENSKAVEACVQLYLKRMKSIVQFPVLNENDLSKAHQDCVREAIKLFLAKAVYDRDQQYQMEANEKMNVEYENFKKKNERESEVRCEGALEKLNKTIETKITNKEYARPGGFSLYQNDISDIKTKYNEKSDLGCKKEETLLKYLTNKWMEAQTILQADQTVSENEKKAEIERQKAIEVEKQRKQAELFAETERKTCDDEVRQVKENIKQLVVKHKQEMESQLKKYNQIIEERRKEQKRLLKEGFKEESENMTKDIALLDHENKTLKQKFADFWKIGLSVLNENVRFDYKGKKRSCVLM